MGVGEVGEGGERDHRDREGEVTVDVLKMVVFAIIIMNSWAVAHGCACTRNITIAGTIAGLGVTLASSDCGTTYSGSQEGYWSMRCALAYASEPSVNIHADESVEGAELQHLALNYVGLMCQATISP